MRAYLNGVVVLSVLAFFLGGCEISNYERAENTSKSMLVFRTNVIQTRNQMGVTLKDLNAISQQASGDSKKDFQRFDESLTKLKASAAAAKAQAADMDAKGQEYFNQWAKELDNVKSPEVRAQASARRAEIMASYAKLKAPMDQAVQLWQPFVARLDDVKTMLSNDLSVRSIAQARDLIKQSNVAGAELLNQLDDVIAELNDVNADLAPSK